MANEQSLIEDINEDEAALRVYAGTLYPAGIVRQSMQTNCKKEQLRKSSKIF
jgi:hypothetical protein